MNSDNNPPTQQLISITPLLRRLWPSPAEQNVTASEIATAISHVFDNRLSPVQIGALLTALHFTGWDRRADVIAQCAAAMRKAACPVDLGGLRETIRRRRLGEGIYRGGLVGNAYFYASNRKNYSDTRIFADCNYSVTLSALEATLITPSTYQRPHRSCVQHCCL